MTKVAILGASGYSALELIKILLRHPHAQISVLGTRREDNPDIAEVHPVLKDRLHLECTSLDPKEIASRAECVFLALPHKAS
ncbi:MAG: N-acetyl-gamma-glutamyl-phosphate reductase, partial [Planctomycetes bacterium]|nr:N-acetyl-gamma-glutamyl-phosphate reductase [Planctomycetota bacterium]